MSSSVESNSVVMDFSKASINDVFQKQKNNTKNRRENFGYPERVVELKNLREAVLAHEEQLYEALYADFKKPREEVKLTEIFPVLQEIRHTLSHLKGWMKPKRVKPALSVFGTRAQLRPEAKGTCLIISPWNYPFTLSFGPLVSALAAGNSVIIKPSELTPNTSALIADLVKKTFSPDLVSVVEGDAEVSQTLLQLPFDHIFFTGSPQVGKIVMAEAAKSLASVTLELGGKSPTIIGPTANIKKAARTIVWGKYANNGQTCIAPDHIFVHQSLSHAFAEAVKQEVQRVYGKTNAEQKSTSDYCRIVNERHFQRLSGLLEDAKNKGAVVLQGGDLDSSDNFIPPTVLKNTSDDMRINQEELFGPILPVIEFDDIDVVIKRINDNPKPLALYIFSKDKLFADNIINQTSSGAVGVNIAVAHFLHPNMPFGGVNNSGIGAAHGYYGFLAFSHEKGVLKDYSSITHMLFPPYTPRVKKLINLVVKIFG